MDLVMPKETAKATHELVKTLLSWKAMSRPYRRRKREFFLMIIFLTLCALIIVYIVFKSATLMLAVLSLAFLATVLATTPPHTVEHRITTQGVITEDHAHLYKELYDFWFDEKGGNTILHIRTYAFFPGILSILLGDMDEKKVRDMLVKYIAYREVMPKTFMDKAANWLSKNFPLESKS